MARYREAVRQGLEMARQRAIRLNVDLFRQFLVYHVAGWRNSRRPVNLAARLGRVVQRYDATFNRPATPEPHHEED
jgi:hypothetical protein